MARLAGFTGSSGKGTFQTFSQFMVVLTSVSGPFLNLASL